MYLSSISSRLLLHDTNNWDLKKCYGIYDGILRDISWSDDSKYLLQVNCKGTVEILSAADHDVRSLQHIPVKDSWSATFHRDGHRHVAIGTKSGNVLIWDTKNKNVQKTFPSPSSQCNVNFISYNAKNSSLAATMANGDTVIYGLVSNIPVLTVKLPYSKSISSMKFHHESRSLLGLATDEGHVVLRDVTTNRDKVYFENIHASPVSDLAFSLINRDVMLSTGYDKLLNVYDIRLQNVVSTVRTQYTLTSVSFNVENQVALGTKNGLVLVYDLRDLSSPFKELKGHNEEVRRVSFQPIKKKLQSAEISLSEEVETHMSPVKQGSSVRTRTSDMFFVTESPPKISIDSPPQVPEAQADSFLVMMGLDESNNNADEDVDGCNKSTEYDQHEIRCRQSEGQKNMMKISTPITNKTVEKLGFPSPMINGLPDGRGSNANIPIVNLNHDPKCMDELKDLINLSVSYITDDNRDYYLRMMMAFTKQMLFMEKQMANVNDKMNYLIQNVDTLVETNQRLVLEVDRLKSKDRYS